MMTERKNPIWTPIILQTLALLGVIVGFAIANEHRLTVVEECSALAAQNNKETALAVKDLQLNQIRTLALLDEIEKRHAREDMKK